jgi:hypothetical protein
MLGRECTQADGKYIAENINWRRKIRVEQLYFERGVISAAGDFPWDAASPYTSEHIGAAHVNVKKKHIFA